MAPICPFRGLGTHLLKHPLCFLGTEAGYDTAMAGFFLEQDKWNFLTMKMAVKQI